MLVRYISAAALAIQCVSAFKDASPFFLFSSSRFETKQMPDAQVASATDVEAHINSLLKGCSPDTYVVVSQPGVSIADFSSEQFAPHLRRRLVGDDKQTQSLVRVSNVLGQISSRNVLVGLEQQCKSSKGSYNLVTVDAERGTIPHFATMPEAISIAFPSLPAGKADRAAALSKSDSFLNEILSSLESYTVLYTTTPPSADQYRQAQHQDKYYEMDDPFPSAMHTDLKRDLNAHAKGSNSTNSTNPQSSLPLFEKYQFLSSGIFMGLTVTLLLLLILYVGVSAIAGLEVSYMAFSKEMGPAAQKKQQQ
ncbi:hypothetical protein MBLNU459_g0325t1 [Dothideomycetes sp. NU459]